MHGGDQLAKQDNSLPCTVLLWPVVNTGLYRKVHGAILTLKLDLKSKELPKGSKQGISLLLNKLCAWLLF